MANPNVRNLHPPEFDRFLHASVGEDRNGYAVTMLSTLARLGLDPWNETADLVTLGRDDARARLEGLLSRFRDVPALASDHNKVARDLSRLLPAGQTLGNIKQATSTFADSHTGKSRAIWTVLMIVFLLFHMVIVGGLGAGK